MWQLHFNQPKKIFFVGIGGISMSGLAEILARQGFEIMGSDIKRSKITDKLETLNVKVYIGHLRTHITPDLDLVVHTAAVKEDNEEIIAAKEMGIPIIDRAELLGQIMKNYKYPVCVSGTHGKTTTTSMISHILLQAKKDPTISVGGILNAIHSNIKVGRSNYFVTEACEYYNSFLKFHPSIGVILNIEEDHLDFFKNIDEIRQSFKRFASNIPKDGTLIINGDMKELSSFLEGLNCKIITFGSDLVNHDYSANHIEFDELAHGSFDLIYRGNKIDRVTLNVSGMHNIFNALSAIAVGLELGIHLDDIKKGLLFFSGTQRRFEFKGTIGGITIIDDYAHHPTEIMATLKTTEKYPHKQVWCVFQPHTYTRTKSFLKEFAQALSLADKIILTDIYAAREKDPGDIHAKDLLRELDIIGKEAYYFSSFDDIEAFLLQNCSSGDLLITMGAGDIKIVGEELLGK